MPRRITRRALLLGNITYRVGERLQWDGASMKFPNCDAANRYLHGDYREGWEIL